MTMLSRFQPDDIYCVYCHRPAAGPCATCRALICAECAQMTGGSVQLAAVCRPCHDGGAGRVDWRSWLGLLRPVAMALGALLVLGAVVMLWRGS